MNIEEFAEKQNWRHHKRQWRENARSWRRANRDEIRATRSPFLAIMTVLLAFAWIAALVALIQAGGVIIAGTFIPLWLGIILLVIIFRAIFWPIHAAHSAYAYGPGPYVRYQSGWTMIVDVLALVSFVFAGWFLYVNYPEVRQFVDSVITRVTEAIN